MEISERLFEIMEQKKLKPSDLAKYLGVQKSVISTWKTRKTDPPSKFLVRICEFLDVNISFILTGKESADSNLEQKKDSFIHSYNTLNINEKKFFQAFMQDFTTFKNSFSHEYKQPEQSPISEVREINYYYKLASAGSGQLLFDTPPSEMIEIPDIDKYKKASYAIGVNGDSMEPLYFDGDIVLVEVTPVIYKDEIGIFEVDGECYIKKFGGYRLISINNKYPDIPLNSHSRCLGKVIDVLR